MKPEKEKTGTDDFFIALVVIAGIPFFIRFANKIMELLQGGCLSVRED